MSISREKQRKTQNIKLAAVVIAFILVSALVIITAFFLMPDYESDDEMKSEVQGRYTRYDDHGAPVQQVLIYDEIMLYYFKDSGHSQILDSWIDWDPNNGTFQTFENWRVLKDGSLACGKDRYLRGGYMENGAHLFAEDVLAYSDLTFSEISIVHDPYSDNMLCSGVLINQGYIIYSHIVLEVLLEDEYGKELFKEYVYAVDGEGIACGEEKRFYFQIPEDDKVCYFRVRLQNYSTE